jgi:hypothetical protein
MTLLFDPFESIVLFLSGKFALSPSVEYIILNMILFQYLLLTMLSKTAKYVSYFPSPMPESDRLTCHV